MSIPTNNFHSSTNSLNSNDVWLDHVAAVCQEEEEEEEEEEEDDAMDAAAAADDDDDDNNTSFGSLYRITADVCQEEEEEEEEDDAMDDDDNDNDNTSLSTSWHCRHSRAFERRSFKDLAAAVCQEEEKNQEEEKKKKKEENHHDNHNHHKIKYNKTVSTTTSSTDMEGEEKEEEKKETHNNHDARKSMIDDNKNNVAVVSDTTGDNDNNDDDDDDDDSRDDHLAAKAMCTQGIGVDSNSCDSDHDCSHERRNSRLSSLFWNNEDEDDAELHQSTIDLEMKSIKETSKFDMPEDVYAFIITSAVWSPSFLFACYVIVIKYIVYGALLTGINIQNFEGADKTATAVKFFLIPVAIAMQNDLMEVYSGISNVKYDKSALEISKYANYWKFNLSYFLRFADGILSLSVNFGVMLETDEVLGVFLNFAALHFLQDIDNVFYVLVQKGFFGDSMEHMSTVCKQIQWPRRRGSNKGSVILTKLDTICFVCTLVVCLVLYFYVEFQVQVLDNESFGGNTTYTNKYSPNTTEAYTSMKEWWDVCCRPKTD